MFEKYIREDLDMVRYHQVQLSNAPLIKGFYHSHSLTYSHVFYSTVKIESCFF